MGEVSVTIERLETYLRGKFPHRQELSVVKLERMTVGLSHDMYLFTMSWREAQGPVTESLVIRMEPERGILPPYDVRPQYEVLSKVQGTGIPVPKVPWLEMDSRVLGRPFFVMEMVDGEGLMTACTTHPEHQTQLGKGYPELLTTIHGLDWQALGLASLGAPENDYQYAEKQIARWERLAEDNQYTPQPVIAELITWLKRNIPRAERTTLCHGDFHTENVLARDGRIVAVLDWEMAGIGDPISDIGYACMMSAGFDNVPDVQAMCPEADFIRGYEEMAGIKVSKESFLFWKVLSYVKVAAMGSRGMTMSIESKDPDMRQFGAWLSFLPILLDQAARLIGF